MNKIFKNKKILSIVIISFIAITIIGVTLQMSAPTSSPPQETVSSNESQTTSQITPEENDQNQIETETAEMALAEITTTDNTPLVVPSTPPEQTSPPTPLTILSISEGEVFVKRAGTNDWIPGTVGMTLQPGDSIKSGGSSRAEITFFEGSTIELDESTILSMYDLGVSDIGSTNIGLVQQLGKTISRVEKLTDQESSYEIETPAAIAAVRGSTMVVTVLADGTTIVANEGGDIRVIAQGIEVIIPEGMKSTITPGNPPGTPEPTNPVPSGGGGGGTGGGGGSPVYTATISTGVSAHPVEVYVGDTVTYTYSILNTGNLQIQSVSITDSVAGVAVYQNGDDNGNSVLDPGETWIFIASYTITVDDKSPLENTATFLVVVNESQSISAEDTAEVTILSSEELAILTESLPDGEIGASYSQILMAVGGTPSYKWSVFEGNLPDGLELIDDAIVGTPTTTGTWTFTIQVTDNMENTATKILSITILEVTEILDITTASLPNSEVGANYSQILIAVGGTPSYKWSVFEGNLPDGLELVDDAIIGTPTTAGEWIFTVQVEDDMHNTVTRIFSIIVCEALTITTNSLPDGDINTAYYCEIVAINGALPYTWSIINGDLPAGLALDSVSGVISGIPTATGTYNFIIRVTDYLGVTVTKSMIVIVNNPI